MNWVGGVRSRLKLQHEKKQQKEFFEKRKYISKVRRAQPYSSPTRKGVSLDLQFIQTVERTHRPQNQVPSSAVKKPVVVDLDGHASIPRPPRRQENLELPNMSPVKTVSVLQLASATDRINANGSNCVHKESDKKKVYREWDPGDHYHMKENRPTHSGSLISSHGPVVYRTPHSTESLGTKMNRNGHIFDSAPKSHRQLHSLSDVESETPYLYLNRGSQVGLCTIQEEGAPPKSVCPKSLGMGSLEEDRNIAKLGKRALYTVSEDFQMTPLKRYHEPTKKHKDHHQGHEAIFGTERALFDQWDGSKRSSHWSWKNTPVGDDADCYGCDKDSMKTRSRNSKGAGDGHEWDRFEVNENLHKKHSDHNKKMAREHLGSGDHPFRFSSDYQRERRHKHKVNELDQRQDLDQDDTNDRRASREKRQHRHDEHYKKRQSNSEDNVSEDRKRRNDGRNFSYERTDSFVSEQKISKLLTSTPVPDYRMDMNPLDDLMDDTAFNKKHPRTLHEEDIGEEDEGHNRDLGRKRGVNPPTADSNILEMESHVEDTSAMPIYKERLFSLLGMSKPATEENASPRLHGHRVDNVQHSSVERRTEQKLPGSTDLNKQVRTSAIQNELDRSTEVCRLEEHSDKTKDNDKNAFNNDLKFENWRALVKGDEETNLVLKEVSTVVNLSKPMINPRDQCTSKELDRSFGSNSSITIVSEDQGQVVPPSVLAYNAAKKTDESVEIECSWNSSNPSQGNKTKKSKKGKQSSAQDALDELLQLDDMCKDAEMDEDLKFEDELKRETKFTKESQVLEAAIDDRVLTFMTTVPATDMAKSESPHHDESFLRTFPVVLGKDDLPQNDLNDVVPNTSSQISSQLTFEAMQLEYYSNLMKITPVKRKCATSGSDRSAPTSEKVKQEPTEDSALHQKFNQLNVFQDSFNKDVTPRRGCDKFESCSKVVKSTSPVLITRIPSDSIVKETVPEALQITPASPEPDVSTPVKDNFYRVDLSPAESRHPESIMSVPVTETEFDRPTKPKAQHIVKDKLSPSGTDLSQTGPSLVNISDKLVTCYNDDETEANIQLKQLIKIAEVDDNDQMQKDLNGSHLDCPCKLHKLEATSPLKRFSDVGIMCDILSEYDKVSPAMKDIGVSCNLLVAPESEKCTNTEPCVSGVSIQTEALSICDRSSNTEAVELENTATLASSLESKGPAHLALKDEGMAKFVAELKPYIIDDATDQSLSPHSPLAFQAQELSSSVAFENTPVPNLSISNETKLPFEDILVSDLPTQNVTKLPSPDAQEVNGCKKSDIEDGMLLKKYTEVSPDFKTQLIELTDSTDPPVPDIMELKLEEVSCETLVVQGCFGITAEKSKENSPLDDGEARDELFQVNGDTMTDQIRSSSSEDLRVDVTITSNQEKDSQNRDNSDECPMETGGEVQGCPDLTTAEERKEKNSPDDSELHQVNRHTMAGPMRVDVTTRYDQGQGNCNREFSDGNTLETAEDLGNDIETPIATCTSQPPQSKVELSVVTPSMSSDVGTKCPDDEVVGSSTKPEGVADVVIDVGREVIEELTKSHDELFLHCSENEVAVENPREVGCCESHCQHLLGSMDDHSTVVKEESKDMSMLSTESDHEGDINSTAVFEIPKSDFQETVIPESPVFGGDASPVFGRLDLDVALIPVLRGDEELLLSPVFREGGGESLFSPVYIKKETSCRPFFVKEKSSSPYSSESEKENEEKTRYSDDSAVTRKTQTNGNSLESGVVRVKNIPEMVVQETKGWGDVSGESKRNAAEAKVMADSKTKVSPGAPFQQPANKSAIGILEQNIRHFTEDADENRQIDGQFEVERDSAVRIGGYENSVAEEDAGRAERHSRMKQKTCSALNDKRSVDVLYAGSSSDDVTTPRSKLRMKRFSIVAEEGQKMGQKPTVSPKGAKVVKKSSQQITKRLGRSKSFKLYSEGGIFRRLRTIRV